MICCRIEIFGVRVKNLVGRSLPVPAFRDTGTSLYVVGDLTISPGVKLFTTSL